MKTIEGAAYCVVHDDFAIEGYDWSDMCHDEWYGERDPARCILVPMSYDNQQAQKANPQP